MRSSRRDQTMPQRGDRGFDVNQIASAFAMSSEVSSSELDWSAAASAGKPESYKIL